MTPNNRHFLFLLATLSGLVIGIAISIAGTTSFSSVRLALDKISGDGSADPYTQPLHERLQYGTMSLGLAVIFISISTLVISRTSFGAKLFDRIQVEVNRFAVDGYRLYLDISENLFSYQALAFISFGLACVTRLPFIETPIRFDEAISWRDYATKPIWLTIAIYNDPNNHVFHNVLSGLTMKIFGESLVTLRAISFLSSCLVVVISTILTAKLATHIQPNCSAFTIGLIASVAICAHPLWNEFSVYARGYTLMTLLWLLSFLCLRHAIAFQNATSWICSALLASLAAWTIPVAVYPVFAGMVFLCLERWPIHRAFVWITCVGIITIGLYCPILIVSGPTAIVGNSYVKSLTSAEWLSQLPSTLEAYRKPLFWNALNILQGLLFAILLVSIAQSVLYRRKIWSFLISISTVAMIVALQRVLPPERTWLWLVVPMSMGLSVAVAIIAGKLPVVRPFSDVLSWGMALIFFSMPAIQWLSGKTLQESMAIGPCPDSSAAIEFLKDGRHSAEPIVAVCPASGTLDWYAKRSNFEPTAFDPPKVPPQQSTSIASVIVAVVNNSQFSQTVTDVLDANSSTRPWSGGQAILLWQKNSLSIYRVEREFKTLNE